MLVLLLPPVLAAGAAPGLFALLGLVVAAVGLTATLRGHVRWAHLRSRTVGAGVAAAGLVLAVTSAAAAPRATPPTLASPPRPSLAATATTGTPAPPTSLPVPVAPSVTTRSPAATAQPAAAPAAARPGTALAVLATLAVKGRAPKTGYSRSRFGQAWADVDRNGCDTRNDVLRRDLTAYVLKAGTHGCLVLRGTLHDPYTGHSIAFVRGTGTSLAVQIDHVVALSDAWQKGAQGWSDTTRRAFANDPLNLLAVDGPSNERKSDGDAATWLPPAKGYRCAYVARQVAVKARYHLWVTSPERDAIRRVLGTCPGQRLPSAGAFRLGGGPEESPTPAPQPVPAAPNPPAAGGGVDPRFGTCTEAKAHGYGPYVSGRDPEYDWYQDRDHDGVVCE